jgi:hypothetical protein
MNRWAAIFLLRWSLAAPLLAQTQSPELSASRLDLLDQRGYFTPAFKTSVHDLVQARQALARAQANEIRFREDIPHLQEQSAAAAQETARLRAELALFAHPEDSDFAALQAAMKNASTAPQDCLALAQAFVWSYPNDPRQAEALSDLQQIQGQMAKEKKNVLDAAAGRLAAHEAIVRRGRAGELSLKEWQDFLRDMSQEELLNYLGPPQVRDPAYWLYSGSWTWDPVTRKRAGLQISFNGTRVLSVAEKSP